MATSPQLQLRQRLESLRAAGVEFLPRTPPLPTPVAIAAPRSLPATPAQTIETVAPPVDSRRLSLDLLAKEIASCSLCPELFSTRTQTVFGTGPLDADICFVGEAPGADEDRIGEPFVGAAGQLLNKIIAKCGLRREDVYILNILKCRPPRNRPPEQIECANCEPFLFRQLDLIRPKVLCCLGGVAAKNLLQTKTGITALRGELHRARGLPVVCTYHPSYLLRLTGEAEARAKWECWDDMKLLLRTAGRSVPGEA